ncbi:MAG: L7Ae/L30e/S12e/Gadd45 family ribosomal protein [Clostridiales bacterium]|nr:L7Ae/L30e/S12e/Gadd45 family ribosomal protein [Clostridiales bacterium]
MSESLSFLGLARRAGRLAGGEDAVQEAVAAGKVRLLILAADAGEKTVRHTEHQSGGKLPIVYLTSDKAALGAALGWQSCAVAAVTDLGMALAYARKLTEDDPRHQPVLDALTETDRRIRTRKQRKPGRNRR